MLDDLFCSLGECAEASRSTRRKNSLGANGRKPKMLDVVDGVLNVLVRGQNTVEMQIFQTWQKLSQTLRETADGGNREAIDLRSNT